jgi:hypothetical protein
MNELVDGEYKVIIKGGVISYEPITQSGIKEEAKEEVSYTYWVSELRYKDVLFGYIVAAEDEVDVEPVIDIRNSPLDTHEALAIVGHINGLCHAYNYFGDMDIDRKDNRPETLDLYLHSMSNENLKISLPVKTESNLYYREFYDELLLGLQ